MSEDKHGRCVVCGRRDDCCPNCHRAHDYVNFVEARGVTNGARGARHRTFVNWRAPQYETTSPERIRGGG